MADIFADLARLAGVFKTRYADKLSNALPAFALLQEEFPYDAKHELGKDFKQPIRTQLPHSHTFIGPGATNEVPVLKDIDASKFVEAIIQPSQHIGRSGISYRALYSGQGDQAAFTNRADQEVEGLWESSSLMLELELLYGQDQDGLGVVETDNGTSQVITKATWIPGLWQLLVGATIQVQLPTTPFTIRTSTVKVTSFDPATRTVTFDADPVSTAGDALYISGARNADGTYNNMPGLITWLKAAASLAGINPATNPQWKAHAVPAAGELTFDTILEGCAESSVRGMMGKMVAFVNPFAWNDNVSDLTAVTRRSQKDIQKLEHGGSAIVFHTSTGIVEVKPHPLVRGGLAAVVPAGRDGPDDDWEKGRGSYKRIGATELQFVSEGTTAGGRGMAYFFHRQDEPAVEIRTIYDQTLYTPKPNRGFLVTGIVNSKDA